MTQPGNQTPPDAAPPAPPATPPNPWSPDSLAPDLKAYAEVKGFKSLADAVVGYQKAEGVRGIPVEEIMRLGKEPTPEQLAAIHSRLGWPEKADQYQLDPLPENMLDLRPDLLPAAHEAKLTRAQVAALDKALTGAMSKRAQAMAAEDEALIKTEQLELEREWGPSYNENLELATRARAELQRITGIDAKAWESLTTVEGFGLKRVATMLASLGKAWAEPAYRSGDPAQVAPEAFVRGMTPEQARAQIKAWANDGTTAKAFEVDPNTGKPKDLALLARWRAVSARSEG